MVRQVGGWEMVKIVASMTSIPPYLQQLGCRAYFYWLHVVWVCLWCSMWPSGDGLSRREVRVGSDHQGVTATRMRTHVNIHLGKDRVLSHESRAGRSQSKSSSTAKSAFTANGRIVSPRVLNLAFEDTYFVKHQTRRTQEAITPLYDEERERRSISQKTSIHPLFSPILVRGSCSHSSG